jgi:excinuclease ABC subunit A
LIRNAVVLYPDSSLAEGAIRGWDRRNVYYFHMLSSLAKHYGFDIDTPFEELSAKHRKIILQGSGKEEISFSYVNDRGDVFKRSHAFEGIVPNLGAPLPRYRIPIGARRSVQVPVHRTLRRMRGQSPVRGRTPRAGERSQSAGDHRHARRRGRDYFESIGLEGRDAQIAEKILKEIRARYRFLVDVGLNYLTLDRSAETLSGGEAQRIRLASQIGAGLVGVMYILDEPSIGCTSATMNVCCEP